jgi:hypothetical protein
VVLREWRKVLLLLLLLLDQTRKVLYEGLINSIVVQASTLFVACFVDLGHCPTCIAC